MADSIEIRISRESANDDVVTIAEWHKPDGAQVREGDILVSLDTSKAILEIEAEADGFLQILEPAGKEVAVGSLIGKILSELPVVITPETNPQVGQVKVAAQTTRVSKAAQVLLDQHGLTVDSFKGLALVRAEDVLAFLNPKDAPVKKDFSKQEALSEEVKLETGVGVQEAAHPTGEIQSQPVGGFFSDAKKSAGERGRGIVWLALNYFFRNYLLGHIARKSPLGINLLVHRLRGVKMGKGVYIDPSAIVETAYPEAVTIGNDVRITANAIIMTHIKAPHALRNSGIMPLVKKPVVLEDHCFIGVNAVVMPGVTIGRGSVVTSGSVVVTNVPPGVMVTGNPAKIVKHLTANSHGK